MIDRDALARDIFPSCDNGRRIIDAVFAGIEERGYVLIHEEATEDAIRAIDRGLHDKWPNARAMAIAAYNLVIEAGR